MCGIAGAWGGALDAETLGIVARRMTSAIRHRGPDDEGVWVDGERGLALGHRRLSIVDLSPDGHQPMLSASGRYVVVFNGEIYNYRELRRTLVSTGAAAEASFRGHSDTGVLLAAIEAWGLEEAVRRSVGMFALAVWDRREGTLRLVRDRLGIKPLYYGWAGGAFLFGSELKALRAHPAFTGEVDRGALALYMRHNCIPAPYSIYRGIRKLMPGSILTVAAPDEPREPVPFWSAREAAERGAADPFAGSVDEAVEELDRLLRDAVALRMVADVPLGAFLSGGVDSSTVVALMQAQSDRPVRTFSIGSHEAEYDEASHARAVARHLGTDHVELVATPDDALGVIPGLPAMYDEPFGDSSQIPTFLVSRLARGDVTVSLSGDGGDELFAGYNRHVWVKRVGKLFGWMPEPVRTALGRRVTSVPPATWDAAYARLGPVLPGVLKHRTPGDKLHKLAGVLAAGSPEAVYYGLVSHWSEPGSLVVGGEEPPTALTDPRRSPALGDPTERMMYWDMVTYLPDDILTKVDRASMAVALEARVPLLDHRVVEFAWRVPLSMKLRDGGSKWLLRQVLYRYVPRELIDRPKTGFGIPLDRWLRGSLREWAEELLDPRRLREEGFLHPGPIRARWAQHLAGTHNWTHHLWDVLMFQAWLEAQDAPAGETDPSRLALAASGTVPHLHHD